MSHTDLVIELEAALALPDTALIVRNAACIAEVCGPLSVRRGTDWLTLGEDGGTHLHLRAADIAGLRFVAAESANAAIEVLDGAGDTLCKVSFRRTNPARKDRYDADLAGRVRTRFAHLA